MAVSPFFDVFPKVHYNINGELNSSLTTATNIFNRLGYLKEVLNNVSSYYVYEIQDSDTPEILAEKVYGDPGAAWMIIYANNIIDPQWDWPLDDETLKKYIIERYGSLPAATSGTHHYEKVIETIIDGVTSTRVYHVNGERLTENALDVPYEYYEVYRAIDGITIDTDLIKADTIDTTADNDCFATGDTSLPIGGGSYATYNVNGKTVSYRIYGRRVSYYDYEIDRNERKRTIKIIKAGYYTQIQAEFNQLTQSLPEYVRTFI